MKIEISQETYDKLKDQLTAEEIKPINDFKDMIGQKYFIRTVTYHWVGKVIKIVGNFIELENASWIADSGRWMQAIKKGKLSEIEPTGTAFINMDSVSDFVPWVHNLPTEQA